MDRCSLLRLIYWNPGGVRDKVSPLRLLAQSQDAHVILLGETKLLPQITFRMPNYFTYRRDEISPQHTAYRGTAILVRRDLIHEELEHPKLETLSANGVLISAANRNLKIYAGYRPPGKPYVARDSAAIFSDDTSTLLAGDLNAKHRAWDQELLTQLVASCTTMQNPKGSRCWGLTRLRISRPIPTMQQTLLMWSFTETCDVQPTWRCCMTWIPSTFPSSSPSHLRQIL